MSTLLPVILLSASTLLGAAPVEDPWSALERLRTRMAQPGGLAADFVQTFTPAGFASGESAPSGSSTRSSCPSVATWAAAR